MKLVAIVGTNAKKSYNRNLLQFMKRHFAQKADIEILEITDVPMFNETDDQQIHLLFRSLIKLFQKLMVSLFRHPSTIIRFHQV